ncbi:MAG: quinolinate synthase NadA [Pseudomonadota bacterium]|nr:quinolinate synthase NadA [Pseudomonadota bacterium]
MTEISPQIEEPKYTPEVAIATSGVRKRLEKIIPDEEWAVHAPYIAAINELKDEKNAALLVHNYQTPEIFHGVADFVGDSLALARRATEVDAEIIVQCGVHFMAETTKLLNPEKIVLIPDLRAGCSLAASITAEDVRNMRNANPGVPVVSYVNTTAEVKAETDVCCTSANAVEVVESLGVDKVIFTPDGYLAQYVATQTDVEIIFWEGACEVHERFTGQELKDYRDNYPGIHVIAHPECPPDVLQEADFVGSTSGMIRHVGETKPKQIVMITECSMSDNVAVEHPEVEFIRPCNLCPHMKQITLPRIFKALLNMQYEVEIDPAIASRARQSVERMLAIGKNK